MVEAVERLLTAGANVEARNDWNQTPLDVVLEETPAFQTPEHGVVVDRLRSALRGRENDGTPPAT